MQHYKHILFIYLLLQSFSITANEYSQPGFYDIDHHILDNGMHIILKKRGTARNAAIRLSVDVGMVDSPCGKRETTHFLEHLLFTGTSKHSEEELDEIISSHGGDWNAYTLQFQTRYEIDIFSRHTDVAMDTLFEIITDSTITDENIEKSRNIIYREDSGKRSPFRRWLYQNDIIQSASVKSTNHLLPEIELYCQDPDNITAITKTDILDTYQQYYVPDRMTLVIVGDINPDDMLSQIKNTFGKLKPGQATIDRKQPPPPTGFKVFESQFSPLLDSEAHISTDFRTNGYISADYYALTIIKQYLTEAMYNTLRVQNGLAYAPSTEHNNLIYYGIISMETDSRIEDIDRNIQLIESIYMKPPEEIFTEELVRKLKEKRLLGMAQDLESNSDFADYYANNAYEIKEFGNLINVAQQTANVTRDDVIRVYSSYLNKNNAVITIESPTLTYTQFFLIILVISVLLSLLIFWYFRHKHQVNNQK